MVTDELHFKPQLRVINDDQIAQIHMATLEVLERTGVKMTHPRGLEILAGGGARVQGDRVRFPAWMVEDALRKAPRRLVLGKRTGERTVFLERDKSYFGPSLDCVDYLDPETHVRRRFISEHVKVMAALCDALPNFEWCMTIGMADDVPAAIADRVVARYTMQYCEKPLVFCCKDTNSVKDIYEMALLLCGGKENLERTPYVVHYSEPISPLLYYDPAVDKILYCAENNIPLINFPCSQSCGSAPATFAGTIVQSSAESLSGLVLYQLVNPGGSFVYGALASVMDMRTSIYSYGANELTLMTVALAQMAQYYRLPFSAPPVPRMPNSVTPRQALKWHSSVSGQLQSDLDLFMTAAAGWTMATWFLLNSWSLPMKSSIRSSTSCGESRLLRKHWQSALLTRLGQGVTICKKNIP